MSQPIRDRVNPTTVAFVISRRFPKHEPLVRRVLDKDPDVAAFDLLLDGEKFTHLGFYTNRLLASLDNDEDRTVRFIENGLAEAFEEEILRRFQDEKAQGGMASVKRWPFRKGQASDA